MTDQASLYSEFSDLYKSLYGIRPRWAANHSVAELKEEIEFVSQRLKEESEEEAAAEAKEKAALEASARWTIGDLVTL